mmetsp:Transcript_7197/g.9759  ORF Transcript_7197/g.9759 Transcript_7197/m.9759 type:complete len:243 (-) Transcript_7197:172-900(-)|eukprot:CAMPEP_0185729376 /NCGR_PEP_ID=MMETSP1171-20130828/5471_1 /TAXON_ID=374046 /ORGANISM="Helicotheca tamensis, Strain CCMP826" /LENGTH=242 /DNA_ID=CAMNT_0028398199 /DNA_START=55 /DNA_END=786 /DNA_ORIENTATION=+
MATNLGRFLTVPSRVANILDWKKAGGAVMSLDVNSDRIGVAIARHPETCTSVYKMEPILFNEASRARKIDEDIIFKLEDVAKQHNVCAFVVGWPLQPNGRMGAPCGKVLHVLDELVAKSNSIFTKNRPFTLWDDRDIPRENVDMSLMKVNVPPPDEWGRSVTFSRVPPQDQSVIYLSREQCHHPSSKDSSVAADLLEMFMESHYEGAQMDVAADKGNGSAAYYFDDIDDYDNEKASLQASLL